jgi:hypothetical protein
VIEEIFGRMGGAIGALASTSPLEPVPTRYYASASSFQGVDYPNWAMWAGGGGWHLSARELAAFLAFITYTEDIIDETQRAGMDAFRLGWRPTGTYNGTFGDYLGHGGSINSQANGVTGNVRAAIMKFNLQVEASLVANSGIVGLGGSAANVLQRAYDAAWA